MQLVSIGASPLEARVLPVLGQLSSVTPILALGAVLYHPTIWHLFVGHKVAYTILADVLLVVVAVEMLTDY